MIEYNKEMENQEKGEEEEENLQIKEKKRHEGKRHFVLTEPLIKLRRHMGQLVEQTDKYGNFYGKNPYEAARKASNSIFESFLLEGNLFDGSQNLIFELKEITKDSSRKQYKYEVKREYLNNPIVIQMKNNEKYLIHFKNTIKSIK